jgi:hypothetical protein
MAKVLYISHVTLFGNDAVAYVVMALFAPKDLGVDVLLDLAAVIGMHHARESAVHIQHELLKRRASVKSHDVLIRETDRVFLGVVYKDPAWKTDGNAIHIHGHSFV